MSTGYLQIKQYWDTVLIIVCVFLFSACVETHVSIPYTGPGQLRDSSNLDISEQGPSDTGDLGDGQTWTEDASLDMGTSEDGQQDMDEQADDDLTVSDVSEEEALAPDLTPLGGPFAFISNNLSNSVSVFDVTTHQEIKVIDVGIRPEGIAIHPDQDRVFVGNNGFNGDGSTISVIDVRSLSVVETISGVSGPEGLVVHPDGDLLYVSSPGEHILPPDLVTDWVMVVDLNSYEVIKEIQVGDHPWGIDISPDGTRLYVGNSHGCSGGEMRQSCISVIDTESNEVISEHHMAPLVGDYSNDGEDIPEDLHMAQVKVTQDGKRLIVVLMHIDLILVLDIETMEPVENGFLDAWIHPHSIDLSPDGRYLYAPCWVGELFWVFDMATMQPILTVPQLGQPRGVSATPDGSEVWVLSQKSDRITVYNTTDWQVTDTMDVSGEYPYSFGHFMTE